MVVVFCQGSPFKPATRNTYIDTNKTLLNTDKKNLSSFFFSFQSDYSDFCYQIEVKELVWRIPRRTARASRSVAAGY